MYFLVNVSPLKRLDVATLQMLWLAQKRVFAMVYHRLKSSSDFVLVFIPEQWQERLPLRFVS